MGTKTLRICLDEAMLGRARSGHFNFVNRIAAAAESRGWRAEIRPEDSAAPPEGVWSLHHMQAPPHPRTMIFRRTYYYPFWHIEKLPQRWRWPVAEAQFRPDQIDKDPARQFAHQLRQRILPGLRPEAPRHVLIALQSRLTERRSFQFMSPLEMVEAVATSGRKAIATLHPRGGYGEAELSALNALAARHPNLTIGGDSRALLPAAEFVVTQNSAVAMDAYLLARPVVLFAQVDFHHITLKPSQIGCEAALAAAPGHKASYAKYLWWFLRDQAIDAMAQDAEARIIAAMKKGGWPV